MRTRLIMISLALNLQIIIMNLRLINTINNRIVYGLVEFLIQNLCIMMIDYAFSVRNMKT